MKHILAAAAVASVVAAPAFAGALIFDPAPEPEVTVAPPPAPMPMPRPAPTWTGGYVGGDLGWGWGDGNDLGTDDGFAFGGQAGYDVELGGFVLGGEAAYSRPGLTLGDVDIDNVVRLTARAGFGFGNTLAYVRGGGAWLDGDGSDWGWTAGAGVEHLVTQNVSAGLEYNFHRVNDFGDTDQNVELQTVGARLNFRF